MNKFGLNIWPNSENIKSINVGFGNFVIVNRIVAILVSGSSPVKRMVSESRDRGLLIDLERKWEGDMQDKVEDKDKLVTI